MRKVENHIVFRDLVQCYLVAPLYLGIDLPGNFSADDFTKAARKQTEDDLMAILKEMGKEEFMEYLDENQHTNTFNIACTIWNVRNNNIEWDTDFKHSKHFTNVIRKFPMQIVYVTETKELEFKTF
jgi:hypothetical protein